MADTTHAPVSRNGFSVSTGVQARSQGLSPIVWLYLLCLMLPFSFSFGTLNITPVRVMMLIFLVPLMSAIFIGRYGRVLPVDILFTLHILWALVALAINSPAKFVENIGATALEFLGGYAVGRAYIRTPEQFATLVKALLIFVTLTLPVALVEAMTDRSLVLTIFDKTGLKTLPEISGDARMGLFRAQTFFAHPIHYGLFCSVSLSLTFIGLRNFATLSQRVIGCMIVGACVFLSLSSGALLAMLLQIGLISWEMMMRNVARRWLILIGMFATIYIVIDLLSNRTPIKVFMSYATFSAHTAYYRAIIYEWGMINVWNNPIFGLGLRSWVRPGYMRSGSVDNFWLVNAMRYGIPGFLFLVTGYIYAIWIVGRRKLTPGTKESNIRLAWMLTFVGLSFTLYTVHIWTSVYSFVFFLLGAGIWISTATSEESSQPQPTAATGQAFSRQSGPRFSRDVPAAAPAPAQSARAFSRSHQVPDRASGKSEEPTGKMVPKYTRFPDGTSK